MFENQIRAGVAVLDEYAPAGWRERVNLETLDAGSVYECPLAQAFQAEYNASPSSRVGAFEYAIRQVIPEEIRTKGGNEPWLIKRGFEAKPANDDISNPRNYPRLTTEWIGYLRRDWS